jgi:NCS1 family nucleobase:cation symporter-1
MQPWRVLETSQNYVFLWLGTYGLMLGAFDGIAIADYWLVRKRRLDLAQLYKPSGIYAYARGFNLRAVGALLVGWGIALIGYFLAPVHFLWNGGWVFSLLGGLIAYWLLMRGDRSAITEEQFDAITTEA